MSKTKIVGYLLILLAVVKTVIDALDGGDFNFQAHFNDLSTALGGAGLIFLRSAVSNIQATK